jgi:hypothetical protein
MMQWDELLEVLEKGTKPLEELPLSVQDALSKLEASSEPNKVLILKVSQNKVKKKVGDYVIKYVDSDIKIHPSISSHGIRIMLNNTNSGSDMWGSIHEYLEYSNYFLERRLKRNYGKVSFFKYRSKDVRNTKAVQILSKEETAVEMGQRDLRYLKPIPKAQDLTPEIITLLEQAVISGFIPQGNLKIRTNLVRNMIAYVAAYESELDKIKQEELPHIFEDFILRFRKAVLIALETSDALSPEHPGTHIRNDLGDPLVFRLISKSMDISERFNLIKTYQRKKTKGDKSKYKVGWGRYSVLDILEDLLVDYLFIPSDPERVAFWNGILDHPIILPADEAIKASKFNLLHASLANFDNYILSDYAITEVVNTPGITLKDIHNVNTLEMYVLNHKAIEEENGEFTQTNRPSTLMGTKPNLKVSVSQYPEFIPSDNDTAICVANIRRNKAEKIHPLSAVIYRTATARMPGGGGIGQHEAITLHIYEKVYNIIKQLRENSPEVDKFYKQCYSFAQTEPSKHWETLLATVYDGTQLKDVPFRGII